MVQQNQKLKLQLVNSGVNGCGANQSVGVLELWVCVSVSVRVTILGM